MYINGKDIKSYNANLLDRQIIPSSRDIFDFWKGKVSNPYIGNTEYGYKMLAIDIEFKGTPNEIENNKKSLLKEIEKATIKFKAIENFYTGFMQSFEIKNTVRGFEILTIYMNVIEHEEEKVFNFDGAKEVIIVLTSNYITPVILEITPLIELIDLNIKGLGEDIKIKNLKKDKKIIINSEDGLITENGLNKFNETDMWEFPYLSPGKNTISIDKDNVDIKIKYKSRWI
jgi:phage-related protein|nr:MAG TPA: distal tail protein [Caudoviricetes sp.]